MRLDRVARDFVYHPDVVRLQWALVEAGCFDRALALWAERQTATAGDTPSELDQQQREAFALRSALPVMECGQESLAARGNCFFAGGYLFVQCPCVARRDTQCLTGRGTKWTRGVPRSEPPKSDFVT